MAFFERSDAPPLTPSSVRVKKVAALSGRSTRSKEGLFRVEGPQAVRSLVTAAPGSATAVYLTPSAAERHEDILAACEQHGIDVFEASDDVIAAMVREQGHQSVTNPQGVIAVAAQLDRPWRDILDSLDPTGPLTLVVCERLQDPGNAGVVVRTADAAGAHAVFFSEDSADPFAPKVVRSSAGSLFHVPIARRVPMTELLRELHARGISTAGTSPRGETSLFQWDPPARLAWLVGNEAQGLEAATLDACSARVSIPLYGNAESLNLATAATLCLFESARAHGAHRE